MTKPGSHNRMRTTCFHYLASLSVTLVLFCLSSNLNAQAGRANFSGTWVYNESKSSPVQGNFRMSPGKLVITQNGNNLEVERTSSGPNGDIVSNDKFTTDGNECVNAMVGDNTRKSTVVWSPDGRSLLFSHYMKIDMQGQTMEFTTSETWKLNETSNTMSVETVFNTPNTEVKSTNAYDKK